MSERCRTIVLHPEWWMLICDAVEIDRTGRVTLGGIPVRLNEGVPKFKREWKFPSDPHIEYELEDEDWCRYFGIGWEVETDEPAIYEFDTPELQFMTSIMDGVQGWIDRMYWSVLQTPSPSAASRGY